MVSTVPCGWCKRAIQKHRDESSSIKGSCSLTYGEQACICQASGACLPALGGFKVLDFGCFLADSLPHCRG